VDLLDFMTIESTTRPGPRGAVRDAIMGAFGPLDLSTLFAGLTRRSPVDTTAKAEEAERPSRREEPSQRWSFSFDGWRTAGDESEYVLV
jgi:hypothetical protein